MEDSEQKEEWPENGENWSDDEDQTMDCGLLEAMVEDDEDINVYNEETFGGDVETDVTTEPLPPPQVQPLSPHRTPSPPRPRVQNQAGFVPGRWSRGRGSRGGLSRVQMFEDPAVIRMVEGRPSLKSLDSSIVDCGFVMHRNAFIHNINNNNDDGAEHSYRKSRRVSESILQDNAIVCVIGHRGRDQQLNASLESTFPIVRQAEPRGSCLRRSYGRRGASQAFPPFPPGSPFLREPMISRLPFNQKGGFTFNPNRGCPSTPQPLTPKMMQLRFGTNSPRPSPFYSPSSNPVQTFSRFPGPITQLHPQHKRLLSPKQRLFQRKTESLDPFCNLMSTKEKEWIIRLQMIQLQSENPYLEDYYYQEYYRRIEAKMAEEELGIRSKREPPKLTTPYITKTDAYTPVVHFEGSLGQVAVSTCYSPRRAISAVHAVQAQSPFEEQKDTKRQRLEVLNQIEKLFMVLLEVEETERMKTTALPEAEERRLREKSERKVKKIYCELQNSRYSDSGAEFLPFLLISKGKRLLARLLPFLKHESAGKILQVVICNLPTLMSKDSDQALPVLYAPLCHVISGLTFSQLIIIIKDLTSSESLSTLECLTQTCQNKFGLSLLYALLSHGEKLLSSGVPLEPSIGDFEIWTDIIFQVAEQLCQCSLVEPLLLPSNLLTLFCRYLDKRTVHQLKNNMESTSGVLALPS